MKKSTKAALLSALVFPGVGLVWLKRYGRACIFIVPAIVALWYLSHCFYIIAQTVIEKVQQGSVQVDLVDVGRTSQLIEALTNQIVADNHFYLQYAETVLIVCWLCSILSSYFVGKKIDDAEATSEAATQMKKF